jgi:hypothetical protein
MVKKKIYFMGLLANTDSSILKVNLEHGFEIKAISDNEGASFISALEGLSYLEVHRKLFINFPCLDSYEKKLYFVSNSFKGNFQINNRSVLACSQSEIEKFEKDFVRSYLSSVLRLMRLFKEGNICMPLRYYYFIDNDIHKPARWTGTNQYISTQPKFTLGNSEISDLIGFIKEMQLPFKKRFLQLAFGNFELSYQTPHMDLSFLSLMGSLEALFNRGQPELAYTISRNTAVLLGEDEDDSCKIHEEMKKLYDKRCDIVHGRKPKVVNNDDLSKLRHYVRESIKEIYKIGKDKDEIFHLLNSSGFGDRPWRNS